MEILEKPSIKKIQIKIMPFINTEAPPDSIAGQLANYGLVLNDGASYKEQITCLEQNGVKRYLTGLNEFAPEINRIADPIEKKAVIQTIRKKVIFLEEMLAANTLKIDDPNFWSKVQMVNPTNHDFWSKVFVEVGNNVSYLDETNPHDLIKICGIEAGGFSCIAKSYEDAKMSANPPKFYLDKANNTTNVKVEVKKIKNQALASLNETLHKNPKKLFYIVKNIDNSNSYQYKNSTSMDIIYEYLDNYISGLGSEKSEKKAAIFFNEVWALSEEELRIKAVLADAAFYKLVATKGDGLYYHRSSDTMLGKNVVDIVSYLKDSMNAKIWQTLLDEVEINWKD